MKFLKLGIILSGVFFALLFGCAGKENNRLPFTRSAAKNGNDPKVKAKINEVYSVETLLAFREEVISAGKQENFEEIKKLANTKFSYLINLNSKEKSSERRKHRGKSKPNPTTPENEVAAKSNEKTENGKKWNGVKVIELLTQHADNNNEMPVTAILLRLFFEGSGTDVDLTGKVQQGSLTTKIEGLKPNGDKLEGITLCISQDCNQVLSLLKLNETNFMVVLSKAINATDENKNESKITNARVDIHAVVSSDIQELMIYFTKNSVKYNLVGHSKNPLSYDGEQRAFIDRQAGITAKVFVQRTGPKEKKKIGIELDSGRFVLVLSDADPNLASKVIEPR